MAFSPFSLCSALPSSVTNKAAGSAPVALSKEDRRTSVISGWSFRVEGQEKKKRGGRIIDSWKEEEKGMER